jgi:putative PIN family toxin of toxin-antitoxin system
VLSLGRVGVIEVFISQPILEEIEGVLIRKFRWTIPRVREATRAIRGFAVLVQPSESVDVVHEDEPDNRILECAIAAEADAIVTGANTF